MACEEASCGSGAPLELYSPSWQDSLPLVSVGFQNVCQRPGFYHFSRSYGPCNIMLQKPKRVKGQISLQEFKKTVLPAYDGEFPHDRMSLEWRSAYEFENDKTLASAELFLTTVTPL